MSMHPVKILNAIIIIVLSFVLAFLCLALYLGTKEQHQELISELPKSFLVRFGSFWLVGLFSIGLLTLINWGSNKIFNTKRPINLKKLFLLGMVSITLACVLGCVLFFYY